MESISAGTFIIVAEREKTVMKVKVIENKTFFICYSLCLNKIRYIIKVVIDHNYSFGEALSQLIRRYMDIKIN
jgi:hypothetical protein